MPDLSQIQPFTFALEGGLVLNQSTFSMQPGMALELENFEPSIKGGYRRINGYSKWTTSVVPYTTADTEKVLMSAFWKGEILAARGEKIFRSTDKSTALNGAINASVTTITVDSTTGFSTTGTILIGTEEITYTGLTSTTFTGCTRGANSTTAASHLDDASVYQMWTEIDSGRTSAEKYNFFRYNLAGTDYIIWADGANNATYYDGTTLTDVTASGAPSDPKYVVFFKDHMFYAGMSATDQEVVFSAPFDPNDFSAANGAGSFVVDSPVTGMISFREALYIFSEERIYKLTGDSVSSFRVDPITRNIGCRNGHTIKEFAGDIIFLGPDGLRTVAGTEKIDDVELGTVSRQVQDLFENLSDVSEYVSYVIPEKTQYRLFKVEDSTSVKNTRGVICVRKSNGYEYGETKGIKISCADEISYSGVEYVIAGDQNGYVHRHESGNTFDGTNIIGRYRSADITAGDPGIRKAFHRVIINYAPEGVVSSDLFLRYDYEAANVARPAPYPFDPDVVAALYGVSTYGVSAYGGQTDPLIRQPVEGSGFAVALRVIDSGLSAPYSIKGFALEYDISARR